MLTKHEIHLRFMEAAMVGSAVEMFGKAFFEEDITHKAKKIADIALETYLKRWPDMNWVD